MHHWDANGLADPSAEPPFIHDIHQEEIVFVKAWLNDFKTSPGLPSKLGLKWSFLSYAAVVAFQMLSSFVQLLVASDYKVYEARHKELRAANGAVYGNVIGILKDELQ